MASEGRLVEPRTLRGFQDLLPEDLLARKNVIRIIEGVFQRYGFVPVETPALEHLETLLGTGGEEINKELFRLESPEGEPIALRFDQTVPFARLIAQYPEQIKIPFRRYAIGPVWRIEKPGPGRFRQFMQLDVDVAGAETVAADAEIIAMMGDVMKSLGVERYCILVNNRRLLDALLEHCGITDEVRQKHVLRVIDKLKKVGIENVRMELGEGRIDESGDPIPGVHLDPDTISKILDYTATRGRNRAEVVAKLTEVLPKTPSAEAALAEMHELEAALDALGVDDDHAVFEPGLARGLDYYTGPVFETILPDAPEIGSVMGGGRYNRLVERFLDTAIPCTGTAVGIDRLMAALIRLGVIHTTKSSVQVLVVAMGKVPKSEALRLAAELRAADIRTETYFGLKTGLKHQLSHADHYEIPVAVILGEDELAKGVVSVKDLCAGKKQRESIDDRETYRQAGKTGQVTVPRAEVVQTVKALLMNHGDCSAA